eukprot:1742125-Pleurochrysis_carterae.AAC.1
MSVDKSNQAAIRKALIDHQANITRKSCIITLFLPHTCGASRNTHGNDSSAPDPATQQPAEMPSPPPPSHLPSQASA